LSRAKPFALAVGRQFTLYLVFNDCVQVAEGSSRQGETLDGGELQPSSSPSDGAASQQEVRHRLAHGRPPGV
jgi:hypothetical protein